MARCNESHKELNEEGWGKCSVPVWRGGLPAGFCNKRAYGKPLPYETFRNVRGEIQRFDGGYCGYVPYLACSAHGGPQCPGIEIEPGMFSGCDRSAGDCPVCGQ